MNPASGKWVRLRIGLVALALLAFGLYISGRFFYLQVIRGPELREEATREYQKFCPILPVRGMILDRNGTELAVSTRVSSVVAHPSQIKDAARLSRELAPILGYKPRDLQEILTRARPFVFVKRHLTPEREEAFRAWEAAEATKGPGGQDHRPHRPGRRLPGSRSQALLSPIGPGGPGFGVLQHRRPGAGRPGNPV